MTWPTSDWSWMISRNYTKRKNDITLRPLQQYHNRRCWVWASWTGWNFFEMSSSGFRLTHTSLLKLLLNSWIPVNKNKMHYQIRFSILISQFEITKPNSSDEFSSPIRIFTRSKDSFFFLTLPLTSSFISALPYFLRAESNLGTIFLLYVLSSLL